VYQIYPRSFADGNGDGVGDLVGMRERIDHLVDLGVDAVWLSPIFVSPMADFGYDVADYCRVDPLFGGDEAFGTLLTALHERGIRVVLDWVPNHSSDQHPWFVESRSSRSSPKRDWYVWRDPAPDGGPPNNWLAQFLDRPAWTLDEATGQYYLHLFLDRQPDLDWSNPDVEAAMHETLRHWMERGVDGFRADVVHLIGKGRELRDLPEELRGMTVVAIDEPFTHELLRRIRSVLDASPQQAMMVGEVYLLQPGQVVRYLGAGDELQLAFDFRTVHVPWSADALRRVIAANQAEFAEPAWPTFVLSNHDQPRHRTRFGSNARARAAAVMSLTMRATPFLFAGEELGLEDAVIPAARVVDPDGRDGCRAPLPWTDAPDHGWPADAWLPFPPDAGRLAADVQRRDPTSMFSLYRSPLRLRRERAVLRRGSFELLDTGAELIGWRRVHGADATVTVVNLSDEPVDLPAAAAGVLLASSVAGRDRLEQQLAPDEAIVVDVAA